MAPETSNFSGLWPAWSGPANNYAELINLLNAADPVKYRISWVQIQAYNSGSMQGNIPTNTAAFAEQFAFDQLSGWTIGGKHFPGLSADQIVIGFPASPSAAPGSGTFPLSEIKAAYNCLLNGIGCDSRLILPQGKTAPYVTGIMNWSANWDASTDGGAPYTFANTMQACVYQKQCS
jgi:chitinase